MRATAFKNWASSVGSTPGEGCLGHVVVAPTTAPHSQALCDTRQMRFVVYGAGAVGGVVGAQLHRSGHNVMLVARGAHFEAIQDNGLLFANPAEQVLLDIPVVDEIAKAGVGRDTVVLLTVKTQDTAACVEELRQVADPETPIVCIQNGVESERIVLRYFTNVYGVPVMCPCLFIEPGVVQAYSAPVTGILDLGRCPSGTDTIAEAVAAAFSSATFVSETRPDIMRWKYRKLIRNLRNGVEAVCGRAASRGRIAELATVEAEMVLVAAGIDVAPLEEDEARRGSILNTGTVDGSTRPGGSVWQSLTRGVGTVETDYLSGHIVLLGRLHGVPTPVNELLQRLAADMAVSRKEPGAVTEDEFLSLLG